MAAVNDTSRSGTMVTWHRSWSLLSIQARSADSASDEPVRKCQARNTGLRQSAVFQTGLKAGDRPHREQQLSELIRRVPAVSAPCS
ncbi:hypothetical protein RRG08_019705 [Elysia crispata]|uniref:Uncharacterized protein n=1 Tax=Elysia crispata TaxID=231223 RepID=A0AAE0YGZ1_9GAST|nr:hypothetical protein RRG08_019705 [Elysia crispata]